MPTLQRKKTGPHSYPHSEGAAPDPVPSFQHDRIQSSGLQQFGCTQTCRWTDNIRKAPNRFTGLWRTIVSFKQRSCVEQQNEKDEQHPGKNRKPLQQVITWLPRCSRDPKCRVILWHTTNDKLNYIKAFICRPKAISDSITCNINVHYADIYLWTMSVKKKDIECTLESTEIFLQIEQSGAGDFVDVLGLFLCRALMHIV